ncbi:carbohydrate ABC transporter permease [Thermostichus vulcanus]|uniref:Carbohydrate ABC transporter permease n=1 Tax=Thermostichus vulcanus str. 'Rupite' TaxID=2813851 RepID=A0ABT0CC52_THEVL|nr:carbohydrate ABC transporter permease [Thermostichus vulcanus]MCJ2543366.1 carbohydrate ABC transporter permease [Thermostichus vulcanus str. 'Rupite']
MKLLEKPEQVPTTASEVGSRFVWDPRHAVKRPLRWLYPLLLYGLVALVLLVFLLPLGWMLLISLKTGQGSQTINLFQSFRPSWENYRALWQEVPVARYLLNTLIVSVGSTLLALLLGIPAGYGLARQPGSWANGLALALLGIRLFPPIALLLPFYLMMRDLRLLDSYTGLILLQSVFKITFVAWFMRGFFVGMPQVLEEAALVDGCSRWGAFWRVALPLSLPGVITVSLLGLIFSWNDFFSPLVLSGVRTRLLTLGILEAFSTYEVAWGRMSALGVIAVLPVLLLALGLQRYYVRGLTAGAVRE